MQLGHRIKIDNLFAAFFILFASIPPLLLIHTGLHVDESLFMFVGDTIIHGSIPYRDFIDNKPPGIFYLNALIFLFFSKSFYASRITLFIFNALSALIIYFLGKDMWREDVGRISSILFLVGIYNPLLDGYFVLTEQFMIFFGLLGVFIFLKSHHWTYLLLAGFSWGIATLFKQSGILFLLIVFIYYFLAMRNSKNRNSIYIYISIKSLFLISFAFFIPIFICILYFYRMGALYDFLFWVFIYFIEGNYGIKFNLWSLFLPSLTLSIIWISAIISVIIIIYNFLTNNFKNNDLFIVIWLLLFSSTLIIRQFGHYLIQILPPLCILASITLKKLIPLFYLKNIKGAFSRKEIANILILVCITAMTLSTFFATIYFIGNIASYSFQDINVQLNASNFIISHTSPNEKIFSYNGDCSIYLFSNRVPPIKYLYLPLVIDNEAIIEQLNKSQVRYILTSDDATTVRYLSSSDIYFQFITKYYIKNKTIGYYDIYKRRE